MITVSELENTIEFFSDLRARLSQQLRKLPKGNLYFKREHGATRAYTRIDGKEKYLGSKHIALIQTLAERGELEKAIASLDDNISVLIRALESFKDLDALMPSSHPIIRCNDRLLDKGCHPLSNNGYHALSRNQISSLIDDWATNHYNDNDYYSSSKDQTTSDGHEVRSKSELAIYEFLLSHNISFKYEEPLDLGTKTKIPDFTLLRSDGKIFIWEHFGMMNDVDYYRNAINTIYLYMDYGFLPYDNIIVSYDYEDGCINMAYIKRILQIHGFIE